MSLLRKELILEWQTMPLVGCALPRELIELDASYSFSVLSASTAM